MTREPLAPKDVIRKDALQRRNAISPEERAVKSLAICDKLMDADLFLDSAGIHVYLPVGSEVDINPIIMLAWEMEAEVGLMRVQEDGGSVQYRIDSTTKYRKTPLGIMEPIDAPLFDMEACGLVIVPLLAADEHCNRLGYGKGYYDQFLTQYPRPTIGVAFEEQVYPELPADDLDIRLDSIYTDQRIITLD